jgi:hypothetical protein
MPLRDWSGDPQLNRHRQPKIVPGEHISLERMAANLILTHTTQCVGILPMIGGAVHVK